MARRYTRAQDQRKPPSVPSTGRGVSFLRRPLPRIVGAATLGLLLLLTLFLWRTVRIGEILTDSMYPTLRRGDVYLIRVDAYRDASPRRGEIVVISRPENGELLVKRVIGVGGDRVGVLFGRAWVNGEWMDEPYLDPRPGVREFAILHDVPPGHLFLMGDNRNFSEDSRDIGTLPAEDVMGRVTAIIMPPGRRGPLEEFILDAPEPPGGPAIPAP